MTTNRFIDRQRPHGGGSCADAGCICRFPTKQAWCDDRNRSMERADLEWAVDESGGTYLRTRPEWSLANLRAEDARKEAERKRFNWRQAHPIDDPTMVRPVEMAP